MYVHVRFGQYCERNVYDFENIMMTHDHRAYGGQPITFLQFVQSSTAVLSVVEVQEEEKIGLLKYYARTTRMCAYVTRPPVARRRFSKPGRYLYHVHPTSVSDLNPRTPSCTYGRHRREPVRARGYHGRTVQRRTGENRFYGSIKYLRHLMSRHLPVRVYFILLIFFFTRRYFLVLCTRAAGANSLLSPSSSSSSGDCV